MDAVIIRKIDLKYAAAGITVMDNNGDYNIYLNDRLSADAQAEALRHEIRHIQQGHFYSMEDITVLEDRAKYNCG